MRRAAFLVALMVLAAGCATRMVRRGEVNPDALAAVGRRLPGIRGLAFTAAVPARALGPEALRAMLAADIEQSYHPGDLERLEAVYRRLGMLPPDSSLRAAVARLYEHEGAGFYDPRTKTLMLATAQLGVGGWTMTLLSALARRDLVGELLVAHELTHALQDQHWGLPTEAEPLVAAQSDRLLARHALLEGDAMLAGFAYVMRATPDRAMLDRLLEKIHGVGTELATRYPDVPELVRESVAFQYDEGTTFAAWALANGGWAAVDAAEAAPPTSTEQVLHPARYFAYREEPVEVVVGGTGRLEAAGWTRIMEDTLGEHTIRLLAGQHRPAGEAARIADGWRGDRLRALQHGDDLVLVWMTAWDSPDEAAEFVTAAPTLLAGARVERREMRVLVVLGPADGGVEPERLAADVWGAPGFAHSTR